MKNKKEFLFCLFTVCSVFLFYLHTLNYPWRHFDEQIIYKETILPAPLSFRELLEYLSSFGFINHIEASNPFHSTISNLRGTPLDVVFCLFFFWLFKKSAFAFHLFSLLLHVLNTALCFFILNKTSAIISNRPSNKFRLFIISLLTLLWALHPTNIESVVFATNFGALVTYFFCFLFFAFYIHKFNLSSKSFDKISIVQFIFIFILYLIPLFLNEYSVTLSLIIFLYVFAFSYFFNKEQKLINSVIYSLKLSAPFFAGLLLFIFHFISLPVIRTSCNFNLISTLERVFWFSPHVFFHFLRLMFYPEYLSIDQGTFVSFSTSLFHSYAIFCFLIMYGLLTLSFLSVFYIRKKSFFLFALLIIPFFLALLPFLHIVSPVYSILCERYLYLPLFFFILGISNIVFFLIGENSNKLEQNQDLRKSEPHACSETLEAPSVQVERKAWGEQIRCVSPENIILILILITTIGFTYRSYLRTLDWRDSVALFTSAYREADTDLIKGLRAEMLGGVLLSYYKDKDSQTKGGDYILEGVAILEKSLLENTKENDLPLVMKIYGLDQKTIQVKTAYLLAFSKLGLEKNVNVAYNLLHSYIYNSNVLDTQIIDLYSGLLFALNKLDEAEPLLQKALKAKPSPTVFIALAELSKRKYNDAATAEKYLRESFKLFPYDIQTLGYLKLFYLQTNKPNEFAFFSYLHGLRTHSEQSLKEALYIYKQLNDMKMIDKINYEISLL